MLTRFEKSDNWMIKNIRDIVESGEHVWVYEAIEVEQVYNQWTAWCLESSLFLYDESGVQNPAWTSSWFVESGETLRRWNWDLQPWDKAAVCIRT